MGENTTAMPKVILPKCVRFPINYAENIKIGKHCWIGLNCIILKGTQIAPHTVVAAGSICTSSYLRENCIIAGNPARIVKQNIDWDRKFV